MLKERKGILGICKSIDNFLSIESTTFYHCSNYYLLLKCLVCFRCLISKSDSTSDEHN